MKNNKLISNGSIIFLTLLLSCASLGASCPVPPSRITPVVDAKVSFDKIKKLYTYEYTLSNPGSGNLPIWLFLIATGTGTDILQAPAGKWNAEVDPDKNYYHWYDSATGVVANKSVSGFKIISKLPPGVTRFVAHGETKGELVAQPVNGDDEAFPDCPGFWEDVPKAFDDFVAGATIGPVVSSQVNLDIKMKRDGKELREEDSISPLDQGKIELQVSAKDFDLSKIDISSLRFGFGQAKPVSSQILAREKLLRLEFNLDDVDVRCDVDRSLFLSGQAGEKTLYGAVKIKPFLCEKELWGQWRKKKEKIHRKTHPNEKVRKKKPARGDDND